MATGIYVRVSEEDRAEINRAAERDGLSAARYLLQSALQRIRRESGPAVSAVDH